MTDPDLDTYPIDRVLAQLDRMCKTTVPDLSVKLSPDVDGMVTLLQQLRRAAAQLRWATDELEDEIAKVMPHKEVEVPGVGLVTLRTATSRKAWDKEGLMSVLTARIADEPGLYADEDTGELLTPTQTVEHVLASFLQAATPSFKSTGLRAFRIDPDEWCETSYGRKTIQTPTPEPWPTTEADT